MKKNMITTISLALLLVAQTSCRENEFGTVDLTLPDDGSNDVVEAEYVYNHPCGMYNQDDFDRVKAMLDAGTAPTAVTEEFQNLKNSTYTVMPYTPNPTTQIVRGDVTGTSASSENYVYAMRDAAAAYQMALLWKLTGNDDYASNAVTILNAWADTCEEITSNDANHMLAAGAQGYTFANAAEILQSYTGWSSADLSDFKAWMVEVFASKNREFLDHQSTSVCVEHYWSNWDLVNMCSYLSIGILTEDDDMVNYVVNYFYNGAGNGCIERLIRGTHTDPLGTGETLCQNQESGRDQGHAQMSMAVAANLCQIAYTLYQDNQTVSDLDFFAANDNAIMKMGEYVALFNVKEGTADNSNATGTYLISVANMPFTEFVYCTGCSCTNQSHGATHTTCSETDRGEPRPGWEIIYNHYAKIKGLSSGYIYSQQFAERIRPEGGPGESANRYGTNSGAFDQLGWGTLMMYRE